MKASEKGNRRSASHLFGTTYIHKRALRRYLLFSRVTETNRNRRNKIRDTHTDSLSKQPLQSRDVRTVLTHKSYISRDLWRTKSISAPRKGRKVQRSSPPLSCTLQPHELRSPWPRRCLLRVYSWLYKFSRSQTSDSLKMRDRFSPVPGYRSKMITSFPVAPGTAYLRMIRRRCPEVNQKRKRTSMDLSRRILRRMVC